MADINIDQVREKYPQYNDLSDDQLVQGLHQKFYSDMPLADFSAKIGHSPPTPQYRSYNAAPRQPSPEPIEGEDLPAQEDPAEAPLHGYTGSEPAHTRRGPMTLGADEFTGGYENASPATQAALTGKPEPQTNKPTPQTSMLGATEYGQAPGEAEEPQPESDRTVPSATQRIAGAVRSGWQGTPPILDPKAQAVLTGIAEQGGVKGYLAALGSTGIHDLDYLNAALQASFKGSQQTIQEVLTPVIGEQGARDVAAFPEAFMGGPKFSRRTVLHDIAEGQLEPPGPGAWGAYTPEPTGPTRPSPYVTARTPEEVAAYDLRMERERANAEQPTEQKLLPGPEQNRAQTPEQAAIDERAEMEARQAQPTPSQPAPEPAKSTTPEPIPPPTGQSEKPASGAYVMVDPTQLTVDPERFQFKASGAGGVTGALHGISRWEPALANPITAWQGEDGKLYVVNGHQRTDLALRAQAAGQPDVQMPARIFREADGYTPEYMRALGAYQNMAEGSGTAVDAAKVLRSTNVIPDDMRLPDLPPKGQVVAQAQALAKLSDEAFGVIENGVVLPAYAAHVGNLITDPTEQMAALDMLARGNPANTEQARLMVQDIRDSGFLRGSQTTLFGDEDFARSLVPERARVLDNAMRTLRRVKGIFKAAVEGEDSLTAAGNTLDREGNIQGKTENEQLLDRLQRNATTRGPISDALTNAAQELASGKPSAGVVSRFLAETRRLVRTGQDQSLQSGDLAHGEEPEGEKRPIRPLARSISEEERARINALPMPDPDYNPVPVDEPPDWMKNEAPVEGQEGFFERKAPKPPAVGPDLFGVDRAQPARRTPEPTIKGDQRQIIMPGMEPSAIQAQASRDQAGPRGNQMPANEGLFGTPETPQPELAAPKKSLWTERLPKLRDAIAEVPGGEPHAAARKFVLDRGKDNGGIEYLVGVDNETGQIVHAVTAFLKNQVPMDFGPLYTIPDDRITFHHNHPSEGGFSPDDLTVGSLPAVRHIVAHAGEDMFSASVPRGDFPDTSTGRANREKRIADEIGIYQRPLGLWLSKRVREGKITSDQYSRSYWDLMARILHAKGLIDYTSTREVPASIKPEFEDYLRIQNVDEPGRYTGTKRLDEALAGLRSPVGGDAQGARADLQGGASGVEGRTEGPGRQPVGSQGKLLEVGVRAIPSPPLRIIPRDDIIKQKRGIAKASAEIKSLFSPTSLRGAKPTEQMMRRHGAEQAQSFAQAVHHLDAVRYAVDRLSKDEQIELTDRMEKGSPQPTPELQAAADALRSVLDKTMRDIQSLGQGHLENAIEDYMGHIYSNYPEWRAGVDPLPKAETDARAAAAMQAKKPLQGSKNFLKRRSFPTQKEAIDAGLIPVTYNPIDLQLMKIREMQKFYHGTRLADKMKDSGIAQWIPTESERDASSLGLVKLDDRAFQPRLQGDANPAGFGRLEPGNWYASEPATRIFNNYMSRGLAGQSIIYDTIRGAGNALNSLQLGLSGFHATFVSLDTMISQSALGLQQVLGGQMGKGLMNIGLSPTPYSLYKALREGGKLRSAWLDPQNATPEWKKLAEDLNRGGGRINMDQFYRNNASGAFFKHLSDFKHPMSPFHQVAQMFADQPSIWRKAMVPIQIARRVLDQIMEPLMGAMVPRAKLGVFAAMARMWDEKNPDPGRFDPDYESRRSAAMIKAWDSVENRLGQMTYDNVYWDKRLKDLAFVTTRSVGWNLGTIREIGGGLVDTGQALMDAARLRKPKFTHRMAYTVMLPIMTGIMGAVITYLATGHGPEHDEHDLSGAIPLDYFYPQISPPDPETGEKNRISMPGYMKDVVAMKNDPMGTIGNKTHPLISTGIDMALKNRDYYGGIIYNSQTDNMAAAYLDYLLNQAVPFSFRAQMKMQADGQTPAEQALSFWGFQPPPKSVTQPERGAAFESRQNQTATRKRENETGRLHFFTPTQSAP